ncbi:adenine deaminase [Treponema vincentii F0403]|uniref:Adenine deaminase n=1 Tax=Treponema vincentii F0403 TaxID=1125702 RepID=S3LC63_9SPIR|nr:adenine deaminase [Treponema vincentii]EPF47240.1 adenine deaminase [Treponema vincentii F0403]
MDEKRIIDIAAGRIKADLVLKNAFVLNVFTKEFIKQDVAIADGYIAGVGQYDGVEEKDLTGKYVCPGLIDAHMHIESTMAPPHNFAQQALRCGTTAVIADPHEIANVAGVDGILYMLEDARKAVFAGTNQPLVSIYFMIPSCVPATDFEHTGGAITAYDIEKLLEEPNVLGLGEMMNYPAVIRGEEAVLKKIAAARKKICDGHAPFVRGKELQAYCAAGIRTDHESSSYEEAYEKLQQGMYILIREGSSAQDLEPIVTGMLEHKTDTGRFAFCTDDKKMSDILANGHIDNNVRKAVSLGLPAEDALCMASFHAAQCYGLTGRGAIAPRYYADIVVFDNITDFPINTVYKAGIEVDSIPVAPESKEAEPQKNRSFSIQRITDSVHVVPVPRSAFNADHFMPSGSDNFHVIGMQPGKLVTQHLVFPRQECTELLKEGKLCYLAVLERHKNTGNIGRALLYGYGVSKGAVASSVGHDSHNIIVAGSNAADMHRAVEEIIDMKGGVAVVQNGVVLSKFALPIGGLMSPMEPGQLADAIHHAAEKAHTIGVYPEVEPLIGLSFLALPVIPELKLTDTGLFDVVKFQFI